uniref:Uncharacterized protein n=1 Tax=Avena sativa TaxID=4498 RepID=A0ACD5WDN6_AVESA
MARSGTNRILHRRKQAAGDDRMSALPDDLLLVVLRRLDTRAAVGTALLSRRWARLHRQLPVLDLRVSNMLPPRYHRLVLLHRDIDRKGSHCLYRRHAIQLDLVPNIRRFERRAMRALTRSVERFLDSGGVLGARPRSVSRLRVEFFLTRNTCCINRLIAKSIDDWGVSDLEAVAKPIHYERSVHTFPSHGLCQEPRASCLRSLKLGCCVLPPLHEFSALTMLVLQDLPMSTPAAAYEGVFTSCRQLQVLHLKSCACSGISDLVVDAPSSEIKELVVDKCAFSYMWLRALPNLESLASLDTRVLFESASFPCFRRWNLTKGVGAFIRSAEGLWQYMGRRHELGWFLGCTPDITNLAVRFTGPQRWIIPPNSSSLSSPLLPKLRKLLVADVPSSWDVSWPRLLLETAPSLETLHIHIAPCKEKPGDKISWKRSRLWHHCLKEFVVAGFEGTDERQICLVRFVIGVSRLHRVALFKKGQAQDKGHWDWEIVTEQHSWTNEEKDATLEQIMDGVSFFNHPVELVLG